MVLKRLYIQPMRGSILNHFKVGDIVCCADERHFGLILDIVGEVRGKRATRARQYLFYDYNTKRTKKILRFAIGAKVKYESKSKT